MPTYFCSGPVTSSELWVAGGEDDDSGVAQLILGITGTYPVLKAERRAARRQFLVEAAELVQQDLITAAIRAETFSYETATDRDIDRLQAPRGERDIGGPWTCSVPLVIVHPDTTSSWKRPKGQVLALDFRTELVFMLSLRRLGWLETVGRVDSPSLKREPYL